MISTRRSVGKTLLRNRRKAVRGVSSRRTGRVSRIRGNPRGPKKRK